MVWDPSVGIHRLQNPPSHGGSWNHGALSGQTLAASENIEQNLQPLVSSSPISALTPRQVNRSTRNSIHNLPSAFQLPTRYHQPAANQPEADTHRLNYRLRCGWRLIHSPIQRPKKLRSRAQPELRLPPALWAPRPQEEAPVSLPNPNTSFLPCHQAIPSRFEMEAKMARQRCRGPICIQNSNIDMKAGPHGQVESWQIG